MRFIFLALLTSCATSPKPETLVMKYVWVYCWQECGKGDRLTAVSGTACHCSDGRTVPLRPILESEVPDKSLFEKFLSYLNGETK